MTITRSQTDSDISYYTDSNTEAQASTNYVTKSGQLSLTVVLKAVHAISLRDSVCSLPVVAKVLDVLNRLITMGALPTFVPPVDDPPLSPTQTPDGRPRGDNEELSVHHLFMDTLTRLIKQLGCPHGCGECLRGEEAQSLRRSIAVTLSYLHGASEAQFGSFLDELVHRRNLQEIMDVFHAFLGFCFESLPSALSPQNRKLSNTPLLSQTSMDSTGALRTGYATNFGAGFGKAAARGT